MSKKKFEKWAILLLCGGAFYAALRTTWSDHWSYWAPIEADNLRRASQLEVHIPWRLQIFQEEGVPVFLLKKFLSFSGIPAHLSDDGVSRVRDLFIVAFITVLGFWFLAVRKLLGVIPSLVALFYALVCPLTLGAIDGICAACFTLMSFFLIPALLVFGKKPGLVGKMALFFSFGTMLIAGVNQPPSLLFGLTFLTFYYGKDLHFRGKCLVAVVAGILLFRFIPGNANSIAVPSKDLLVSWGPGFLLILAFLWIMKGRGIAQKQLSSPRERFARAIVISSVVYYFFSPTDDLPSEFIPALAFLIGWALAEIQESAPVQLRSELLKKTVLILPAALIFVRLIPSLPYLFAYPNPVYRTATLGSSHFSPNNLSRENYEMMKVLASLIKTRSHEEDIWIVPERFSWNDRGAHPFLRYWSGRQVLGDGVHVRRLLARLSLAKEKLNSSPVKKGGRLLVVDSSHATEGDIRQYLVDHGKFIISYFTIFGEIKIYQLLLSPNEGQIG